MRTGSWLFCGALWLAGCGSVGGSAVGSDAWGRRTDRLAFENATVDVVRVYLEVSGRPILLGRVEPFELAALRIPAGYGGISAGEARLVVLPVGAPSVSGTVEVANTVRSDMYQTHDVLRSAWRYSGTRVTMQLGARR